MSLVKFQREAAGLTMSEVARRADIRLTKLWKIEHDTLRLKAEDVARLARAIGCHPCDLIPDPDAPGGHAHA